MTTDIALPQDRDLHLFARDPVELAASQGELIGWCVRKVGAIQADIADLRANLAVAERNKWKVRPWRDRIVKAGRLMNFYVKMKRALEAGYYIIPPFPVDVFAIRVPDEARPKGQDEGRNRWLSIHVQHARQLPAGEGRYVSDRPMIERGSYEVTNKDNTKSTVYWNRAEDFDEVDFPIRIVKPEILAETGKAMALKIFDSLGVLPATRSADPIVVGHITDPRSGREPSTFFIGWWISTHNL